MSAGALLSSCSCSDPLPVLDGSTDAHDASDPTLGDASGDSDAWHPFVPRDAGPLAEEPCAAGLTVRRLGWPLAETAPRGHEVALAGRGHSLAAGWRLCREGEDCHSADPSTFELAFTSFDASTGEANAEYHVRRPGAVAPLAVGWTLEGWRIYFNAPLGDPTSGPFQIAWFDVTDAGPGEEAATGPLTESRLLMGRAVGTNMVGVLQLASDDPHPHQLLGLRGSTATIHVLDDATMPDSVQPVLSRDGQLAGIVGIEQDSLQLVAGRLDLETGELSIRQLPIDLQPPLSVVLVEDDGRLIVAGVAPEPDADAYRLRYVWLDAGLEVIGSWTTPGQWLAQALAGTMVRTVPVVESGDQQILIFVVDHSLYAGISEAAGRVRGGTRPVVLIGSGTGAGDDLPWAATAWDASSVAYSAIAYGSELTLLVLRCGH